MTSRRKYDSPARREQSRATRRRILEAADGLFERDGYAAAGVDAIAARAGVSLRTVYIHFPAKYELLRALWHLRLRGDLDDAPVGEREWFDEVLSEPQARRQLELNMRNSVAVKKRVAGLFRVIRDAAGSDPAAAQLWSAIGREFRANQLAVAESLEAKNVLREGLDAESAADILWSLNHPDFFALLCGDRGWTIERYADWVQETLVSRLLKTATD